MKEKVYINIKGLQLAAQNVPRDYEEDEDDRGLRRNDKKMYKYH